jgi:hypothetical protein
MALAYALDYIEQKKLARLTNYGEYFAKYPPTQEVHVHERSSWSCVHGVARWESNCGCNSGNHLPWTQEWRRPLREAFDWLHNQLTTSYELEAKKLLRKPWQARDDYFSAVIDRSSANVERFLAKHSARHLSAEERTRALRLLEMSRHLMLMYTSCGWFFDEPTGPETIQVLQYAARAVQLGEQLFGGNPEIEFLKKLESVHSNIPEFGNGREIYERFVRPAMLDLPGVAAHYAISSFFEGYDTSNSIYSYCADLGNVRNFENGRARLAAGNARITSRVTEARFDFNFAVLYCGAHNLHSGICQAHEGFPEFIEQLRTLLSGSQFDECLRSLQSYFGTQIYSLKSLFPDERRRIVGQVVDSTLADLDVLYRDVYEHNTGLIQFLRELRLPMPAILQVSSEFVLQNAIQRSLTGEETNLMQLGSLLQSAGKQGISLDPSLRSKLSDRLDQLMRVWAKDPFDTESLQQLERLVSAMSALPFEADLWKAQNTYCQLRVAIMDLNSSKIDPQWMDAFSTLGDRLGVAVPRQLFSVVAAVQTPSFLKEAPVPTNAETIHRGTEEAAVSSYTRFSSSTGVPLVS